MREMIIGVVLGAAISAIFYYLGGGRDLKREARSLRKEAAALRKLQELTIFALTNSDAKVEPTRNKEGNITGLKVKAGGRSMGMATARGTLTLTPSQNGSGQGN
jgi:hypothetical protein